LGAAGGFLCGAGGLVVVVVVVIVVVIVVVAARLGGFVRCGCLRGLCAGGCV